MKRLLKWFGRKSSSTKSARSVSGTVSRTQMPAAKARPATARSARREPAAAADVVDLDPHLNGELTDNGPGKNVLIQNRYKREDTGTHDTLKILDDSVLDTGEEAGFDPYNTGRFDRSRNWDRRSRN